MLIQLYFNDYNGAAICCFIYMAVTCVSTCFMRNFSLKYAGIGFLAGGICFTAVALLQLRVWMKHLMYHVLCGQPIIAEEKNGFWTSVAMKAESRYKAKHRKDLLREEYLKEGSGE